MLFRINMLSWGFVGYFAGLVDLWPLIFQVGVNGSNVICPSPLCAPKLRPMALGAVLIVLKPETRWIYLSEKCVANNIAVAFFNWNLSANRL